MKAVWVAALCLLPLCAMADPVEVTDSTALLNRGAQPTENLPCPKGWRVEANPSVENSLSYLHEGGDLAVNISYVADTSGQNVLPEAYARVAAEQMNCQMLHYVILLIMLLMPQWELRKKSLKKWKLGVRWIIILMVHEILLCIMTDITEFHITVIAWQLCTTKTFLMRWE